MDKDIDKDKDKVIMWLLPGSCNLTLLLDTWQFLIQGEKDKDRDQDKGKDKNKDTDSDKDTDKHKYKDTDQDQVIAA